MPFSTRRRQYSSANLTQANCRTTQLAIFDSRMEALSLLTEGLQPETRGHVLSPDRDGIAQISALLCKTPAANLTLVARGFAGGLQLGSSTLTLSNLAEYEHQLRGWFSGIENPSLSLLSSSIAKGQQGRDFISRLESITGASVRASARPIGQGHWLTASAKTFKPVLLNTYSFII